MESGVKPLFEEVNAELLMEYTKNIAQEVRLSGSEEELRAFYYVKGKLEEFGIEPVLEFCDAYISLPVSGDIEVEGVPFTCITHSMGATTPEGGVEGPIVYVGKGLEVDFLNQNVQGKIVLIDGLATGPSVERAEASGAIAAIFINAEYTHEMIVSSVWGSPTTKTFPLLPNLPVVSLTAKRGNEIKSILSENVRANARVQTKVDTGWRKIPFLTGEIKGNVEPEKFVLFSGHIDSWHYGAMDNGTANATMVEVARIIASHKSELRRSVRFAFWSGHSHGRYAASTWYCDQNWEELHENGVAHVNIDSVGAKGASILSENNCMAETKEIVKRSVLKIANQHFNGSRYSRAGDQSFWGTGMPSLLMGLSEQPASEEPAAQAFGQLFGGGKTGGYGWWWHTTEDMIDKIDLKNLRRDCQVYLDIVYDLATAPIIPVNHRLSVAEMKDALNQYADQAKGAIDFGVALERVIELENKLNKMYGLIENGENLSEYEYLFNEGIIQLSQELVPLNYVKGNRFDQDLAVNPVVIPSLSDISKLEQVEPQTHEFFLLRTELTRSINKVNYALLQANRIVDKVLDIENN
ncbi:M28 family peptidase [Bacillus sp. REN16]|uniref:M28 family peptidase n=1 Tax=Bacillus sp. REN16 TaxID=2887296 RepID=UPI001E2F7B3B|nr:M28 family peptidase [Bacillus sp. REN16]MCC3356133.1 M28 family peptidase [Bacillus sp. REN16]